MCTRIILHGHIAVAVHLLFNECMAHARFIGHVILITSIFTEKKTQVVCLFSCILCNATSRVTGRCWRHSEVPYSLLLPGTKETLVTRRVKGQGVWSMDTSCCTSSAPLRAVPCLRRPLTLTLKQAGASSVLSILPTRKRAQVLLPPPSLICQNLTCPETHFTFSL